MYVSDNPQRVRDFTTTTHSHLQSAGSRRLVADLPANQLGPRWRRKLGGALLIGVWAYSRTSFPTNRQNFGFPAFYRAETRT